MKSTGAAKWGGTAASVAALICLAVAARAAPPPAFEWTTVVNNTYEIPGVTPARRFNSYNPPSVNRSGRVVLRARSRGGPPLGPATHGIYRRDISACGAAPSPIVRILDRSELVPEPNNLATTFVETPSFPRIDAWTATIVTRGNHPPVWSYDDPEETRAGTSGIYCDPFGDLISGAAKLGSVPDFSMMAVPGASPPISFDVFPGAPSVTSGPLGDVAIVFKGNFTVPAPTPEDPEATAAATGVYYRDLSDAPLVLLDGTELSPAGGTAPIVRIADSTTTRIPGTSLLFGSTAPPSAALRAAVFTGLDDEANPAFGGIYLAPLVPSPDGEQPALTELVRISERVPGEPVHSVFTRLGEALAFDGRHVAFWGAWGTVSVTDPDTGEVDCVSGCRQVSVSCPTEGNARRIEYCLLGSPLSDPDLDPDIPENHTGVYVLEVPVHQGIFVHDTELGRTRAVAKTGARFQDFVFWAFTGRVPGVGEGEDGSDDDGEPARFRSSTFVAVSAGPGATYLVAFKAMSGDETGVYLQRGPGQSALSTVAETGMDGRDIDPDAPAGSVVTELGFEREGLRGKWLVLQAKMGLAGGTEEDAMAGIYGTRLPD
ncbi:MAG: hypothetical protein R3B70_08570 [Polyangiaceae bacterium]